MPKTLSASHVTVIGSYLQAECFSNSCFETRFFLCPLKQEIVPIKLISLVGVVRQGFGVDPICLSSELAEFLTKKFEDGLAANTITFYRSFIGVTIRGASVSCWDLSSSPNISKLMHFFACDHPKLVNLFGIYSLCWTLCMSCLTSPLRSPRSNTCPGRLVF